MMATEDVRVPSAPSWPETNTLPSGAQERGAVAQGLPLRATQVVEISPAPVVQAGSGPIQGLDDSEDDEALEPWLEQTSILFHLAFFAQLGVIIRMCSEFLFGPSVAAVTSDKSALFLDVPANMLGSFLMGIVGFVSKKSIAEFSQPLAIGLSTGLCGSITTFASWNQRVLAMLFQGLVLEGLSAVILGASVAYYSFIVGLDTAEGLRDWYHSHNTRRIDAGKPPLLLRPEHYKRRWSSLLVLVGLTLLLWAIAGIVFALETDPNLRKVALACLVGPPGCWVRWWLSRFNGQGLGKGQHMKWLPFGTLSANLLAVSLEAGLSSVNAIFRSATTSLFVGGFQSGLMGCMSTVSTLIQEVYILRSGKSPRSRPYVYLYLVSFGFSVVIGALVYGIPVWVYGVAYIGYSKV